MGQFYILIDIEAYDENFLQRVEKIAELIEVQPDARLPGTNISIPAEVEVNPELWLKIQKLAKKNLIQDNSR